MELLNMTEAVDILVKECALNIESFNSYNNVTCVNYYGQKFVLTAKEDKNGYACFEFKGGVYYMRRRFDLHSSGDFMAYRVCGDKMVYFGLGKYNDDVIPISALTDHSALFVDWNK